MVTVSNISIAYTSNCVDIVQDVSFSVKKGDRIAILGPSGCGKTTLLNVIAGMIKKDEVNIKGEVIFSGEARNDIGVVFQNPALLPWKTAYENIAFALGEKAENKDDDINKLMRMVGLGGYEAYYPYQLSVGMKQRVNFARALAIEPTLLLMDEPFSALDVETKKTIQEEFLKILTEKEMTTIFVTHSIEEAVALANKVIVLSKGPARIKTVFENGDTKSFGKKNEFFELYED